MTDIKALDILNEHFMLFNKDFKKALDKAISALAKRLIYKEHNLQKNPNDLPLQGPVILKMQPTDGGDCWYYISDTVEDLDLHDEQGTIVDFAVAWRYLEPMLEDEP